MRLLKTVLDFYLRSSLHVAVCFVALLRIVKAYGVFYFKPELYVLAFCLIVVSYNLYSDYAIKRTITCSWHRPDWILYLLRSIQLISFVFALCIPFEIRDLKYDSFKVKTLPQVIGIKNTKRLGYTLVSVLLFIQFLIYTQTNLLELDIILTFIVLGMAIYFSDKFKSDYYASFFVEAIPLLWLGMYWVF